MMDMLKIKRNYGIKNYRLNLIKLQRIEKLYSSNAFFLPTVVSPCPFTGLLLPVSFLMLSDNRRSLDFDLQDYRQDKNS